MSEINPIEQYFAIREGRVKLAFDEDVIEEVDPTIGQFTKYLAAARATYLTHQNSHWICLGYDKHLLFQRLYENASERVDEIAEKMLGLFDRSSLNVEKLKDLTNELMIVGDNVIENSVLVEKQFIEIANNLFKSLEETGKITLGLDDMIPSHVSQAEEALYLLAGLR